MDNCLHGSHQDDFYHRRRFARDFRIALCAGCHDKLPIPLYYSELSICTLTQYSFESEPRGQGLCAITSTPRPTSSASMSPANNRRAPSCLFNVASMWHIVSHLT